MKPSPPAGRGGVGWGQVVGVVRKAEGNGEGAMLHEYNHMNVSPSLPLYEKEKGEWRREEKAEEVLSLPTE